MTRNFAPLRQASNYICESIFSEVLVSSLLSEYGKDRSISNQVWQLCLCKAADAYQASSCSLTESLHF